MLNDILKAKKSLFADGVQTVLRGQENRNRRVVFLQGNLVIRDCAFQNSKALYGGAVYASDGVQLVNCLFTQNHAENAANALWLDGPNTAATKHLRPGIPPEVGVTEA